MSIDRNECYLEMFAPKGVCVKLANVCMYVHIHVLLTAGRVAQGTAGSAGSGV